MFLVFAGDNYYPSGGWEDFRGAYKTLEEAQIAVEGMQRWDWWHIVDVAREHVVDRGF